MAATTAITAPWQLMLLWGLVIGSAAGALAIPLAAIVATRWFVARRGLVTGLMRHEQRHGPADLPADPRGHRGDRRVALGAAC